jgi:hypothetical protein
LARHPSVVYKNVHSAEFALNLRNHLSNLIGLRDVSLNRECAPPQFLDLSANFLGVFSPRPKIHYDVRASLGQRQRNRRANAAASSSNKGQLSVQSLHKMTIPHRDYPIRAVVRRTGFVIENGANSSLSQAFAMV